MSNNIQSVQKMAAQAKALFPAENERVERIDRALVEVVELINEYESRGDRFGAKIRVAAFREKMNSFARIAYRRKFQTEIVKIEA